MENFQDRSVWIRIWIQIRILSLKIMDPDPVCPERLDPDSDPDPVNIRPDSQYTIAITFSQYSVCLNFCETSLYDG